jgi:hypothetical protein
MAYQTSGTTSTKQRARRGLNIDDPSTCAITLDMTCAVEDFPPMTDDECAAAARILDDLRIMQARRYVEGVKPPDPVLGTCRRRHNSYATYGGNDVDQCHSASRWACQECWTALTRIPVTRRRLCG